MKRKISLLIIIVATGIICFGCGQTDQEVETEYSIIAEDTDTVATTIQADSETDIEEQATGDTLAEPSKEVINAGTEMPLSMELKAGLEGLYPEYLIMQDADVITKSDRLTIERRTIYEPVTSEQGILTLDAYDTEKGTNLEHIEIFITPETLYYMTAMPKQADMIAVLGEITPFGYVQCSVETAYINQVENQTILYDPITIITDPDSEEAKKLGLTAEDIIDYYIDNSDETKKETNLTDSIPVLMYNQEDWSYLEEQTAADFLSRAKEELKDKDKMMNPYQILFFEGNAVLIREIYLP